MRWLWLMLLLVILASSCQDGANNQQPPTSTATPPSTADVALTPTCPDPDPTFCAFAEQVDAALQRPDSEFLVDASLTSSETCSYKAKLGPCASVPRGTVLSGYQVAVDRSETAWYATEEEYRGYLEKASRFDPSASDEYGEGTWRLAAIIDQGLRKKILITTSIGPDPIYQDDTRERRVFFWSAEPEANGWRLEELFSTIFDEDYLAGAIPGEGPIKGWARWGGP